MKKNRPMGLTLPAQLGEASPAIQFDRIQGYSAACVVLNVHGSWTNQALMLGVDKNSTPRDIFFEFVRRYEQFPGEMKRVSSAPWLLAVIDQEHKPV